MVLAPRLQSHISWCLDFASGEWQKLVAVYEDGRELGRLLYFSHTRSPPRFCKLAEGVHAPWTNYCAPTTNHGPEGLDAARQGEIAYRLARQLLRTYIIDPRGATTAAISRALIFRRGTFLKRRKKLGFVEIEPSAFFHP